MWFALALLGAMWLSAVATNLPLMIGATLLAIAALVMGVRALVRLRRARVGGLLLVVVIISLGLGLLLVLSSAAQLVFWREYLDFAQCTSRAITSGAQRACQAELDRALSSRAWSSILG